MEKLAIEILKHLKEKSNPVAFSDIKSIRFRTQKIIPFRMIQATISKTKPVDFVQLAFVYLHHNYHLRLFYCNTCFVVWLQYSTLLL